MVLIESDSLRRDVLARALRDAGIAVLAVSSIAELERWPRGEIVVTESSQFTPWWREVGSGHIVVLAETVAEGSRCCRMGAARSLARRCPPARLVTALRSLGAGSFASFVQPVPRPRMRHERAALVH
jgi:hypothetical protein